MKLDIRAYAPHELHVGLKAEFEREVSEADVLAFAAGSGDENPLHVDATYAGGTQFQGRIAHGAFQIGLASALVGMYLPGKHVLLGSVRARFPAPLYFPCRVIVGGEITSWNLDGLAGTVKVVIRDASTKLPTAEIYMGFTFHHSRVSLPTPSPTPVPRVLGGKKMVLVTGASGGLGTELISSLSEDYFVLALVNRHPLPTDLRARPGVHELCVDLAAPEWSEPIEAVLRESGESLYAIVHAAWPGAPRGGLLGTEEDTLEEQVRFGTVYAVRLAKLLFAHAGAEGGRFVVVGSIFGSHKPNLAIAAYSVGKAALESTVRLLAPEMARKSIAVNAVCPTAAAVGMNKHATERWLKTTAALVPLGRLCEPHDVSHLVRFLLSPGAAFVSGQILELTGAQL